MNFFLRSLASVVLFFLMSACSISQEVPSETTIVKNESEINKASHFVRLVLPNNEASRGARITLSLEGRAPMIQTIDPDFEIQAQSPPEVYFLVGETVAPATLEVRFLSGETKTMRKVVFDTTLTLL
jgi:hypothetical protein